MTGQLIALHGFLGCGRDWDAVRANSKCGLEWICPDLFAPGSAISFEPPAMDGPCWLAGYSFGARLALSWMQREPERWSGALLLSANPGNFQSDNERAARRAADDLWAEAFRKDPWNDVLARWNSQDVLAGSPASLRTESDYDHAKLSAALRDFSVSGQFTDPLRLPANIVWMAGARDEKFVALQASMREAGFSGTFPLVEEAGHRLLIEAPDAVVSALDHLVA